MTKEYDSGHRAIVIDVDLQKNHLLANLVPHKQFKLFKKNQVAHISCNSNLHQSHRNLRNKEAEEALEKLYFNIRSTIAKTVPTTKPTNSISKYVKRQIDSLHTQKSRLLTRLDHLKRNSNHNVWQTRQLMSFIQAEIDLTKSKIKSELAKAFGQYRSNKIKNMNHKIKLFPKNSSVSRTHYTSSWTTRPRQLSRKNTQLHASLT